jgi:hypothetical protein
VEYQQYRPTVMGLAERTGKFQHLTGSLCLFDTWCSLVGPSHVTLEELQKQVALRNETVYEDGWHSVAHLNSALDLRRSNLTLAKTTLSRCKNWSENPFLLHQKEGLFIISAKIYSRAEKRLVDHFIGVDCWNRQFIDVLDTEPRRMNKKEWGRLNIRDWQRTSAICLRSTG